MWREVAWDPRRPGSPDPLRPEALTPRPRRPEDPAVQLLSEAAHLPAVHRPRPAGRPGPGDRMVGDLRAGRLLGPCCHYRGRGRSVPRALGGSFLPQSDPCPRTWCPGSSGAARLLLRGLARPSVPPLTVVAPVDAAVAPRGRACRQCSPWRPSAPAPPPPPPRRLRGLRTPRNWPPDAAPSGRFLSSPPFRFRSFWRIPSASPSPLQRSVVSAVAFLTPGIGFQEPVLAGGGHCLPASSGRSRPPFPRLRPFLALPLLLPSSRQVQLLSVWPPSVRHPGGGHSHAEGLVLAVTWANPHLSCWPSEPILPAAFLEGEAGLGDLPGTPRPGSGALS